MRPAMAARPLVPMPAKSGTRIDVRLGVWLCEAAASTGAAIPPPVPRQFTDEELKQQYGIHMATRLPADEAGKESKWADIDDDEDDWAPETVEWMDGTKSTVTATDTRQLQTPEPEPKMEHLPPVDIPSPPADPAPAAPQPGAMSTKTILKPGSHMPSQPKPAMVLRGSAETAGMPTPTASAPMPAKSPWAPLPPVGKVSPVPFVAPQHPAGPFSREASGFDAFPPSGPSPKEIAADDFNRTWSGEPPRHNQLFNSQSGLFESVNDGRRAQIRSEHGSRQPAVLQRPGHHLGPAEPSAAFQTHRSGGDVPFRQRNRTGSAGSAGRRMSFSRPHDFPIDRYDGPAGQVPPLTPGLPDPSPIQMMPNRDQRTWRAQEPAVPVPPQGPMQGLGAPVVEGHEEVVGGVVTSDSPADPVAAQQIWMREKLERARLQKQLEREAEEREEQARKERLREKMKALEPAAPSPSTDLKDAKAKDVAVRSPQPKPAQVSSPPKPPIPTAEGEVAQYGMMKVHQPHPVKRANFIESSLMRGETDNRKHADTNQQRFGQSRLTSMDKSQKFMGDRRPASLEGEASPWRSNALPDSLSGWSSSNASGANVWAPPQSKDRALGNGIFDPSGFRITSALGAVPGPISAPAHGAPGRNAVHGHVARSTSPPGPIAPPSSLSIAPPLTSTSHPLSRSSTKTPALSTRSDDIPHSDPQPHALHNPPAVQDSAAPTNMAISAPSARYDGKSTTRFKAEYSLADWQNLPDNLQSENARWMEAAAKRTENPQASRPQMSTIKHTFRKIAPTSHYLDERKVISEETKYLQPDQKDKESFEKALELGKHFNPLEILLTLADKARAAATIEDKASTKPSTPATPQKSTTPVPSKSGPNASAQPRSSRFFPRGGPVQSSDKSESPPPPENSSLDSSHETPRVKMPTQVVVKLPAAKAAEQIKVAGAAQRAGKSQGSDWQSRFNNLLGVSKSNVRADKSSLNTLSKAPLDEAQAPYAVGPVTVSVSLPTSGSRAAGLVADGSDSPVSKGPDDDIFPQPDMGSTPTIQIPRNVTYVHEGEPAPHYRPPHRHMMQFERDLATSRPTFDASDLTDYQKGTVTVTVHMDAKREAKNFTMTAPTRRYQRGGFAGRYPKRGTNEAFAPRGARKNSSQFHRETANMASRGGAPRQRSSRGGAFQEIRRQPVATGDA